MELFDVVVVGGGHAGVEACAAAARRGARVAMITQAEHHVGTLSCNPSIGGLGKGHLVREVDAFDGVMAVAADGAAIHHRMLNRSKGLAVQGPRVQVDRALYRCAVQRQLAAYEQLRIVPGEVIDLTIRGTQVTGVVLANGARVAAGAVVLATGTFLGGRIFRGIERLDGGRIGERPATRLAERLRAAKLPVQRLKTGTPPRLDGRTIDWARLTLQMSDVDEWTMSAMTPSRRLPQLACAITYTGEATHDVIRAGLKDSPLHSGSINGRGPRYCPSIEDKIVRFADRTAHQIFLEPEGLDDWTIYPNGISTSLASDVQASLVSSIPGLETAQITQSGYAVEYDYIDPRSLDHRLALAALDGVFCAGQLNGTTGYEEAAAQGLVAGLNAAAHANGLAPVILDRASSYIGVLIDDLVLQGVSEPYRMLTARAEYRLALRADNAEVRLSQIADEAAALRPDRLEAVGRRAAKREAFREGRIEAHDAGSAIAREVEEDRRYAPYLERQAREIARMRTDASVEIATGDHLIDVPGLSHEMIERLRASAPRTLDQASRVAGVTPAALTALWLHSRRSAA